MTDEPGKYLPIGKAAKMLGIATNTLRAWEKAGRIRAYRTPTGRKRYLLVDLEALITDD